MNQNYLLNNIMPYHGGYEKCAHLYDLFDEKENVQSFLHYAPEAGEILDIGAGTGRIAIPIAENGIKIYRVEPSPAMVKEFKKRIEGRKETRKN
jgi:2-polyprenyl-3-methyl-5-hydroxy-6-metoxy-1,4-benzoquinol methylase